MTYLTHLTCSNCLKSFPADQIQSYCYECQAPLLVQYNLPAARSQLDRDEMRTQQKGLWRWHDLLPVYRQENQLTLGEGDTPLLHLTRLSELLGMPHLYVKDEGQNPTGTFKARGLAAAVSKAKELGIKKLIIPTAGNAGGAMAAYAARAGMEACVVMPKDTPRANIEETAIYGAEIILVDGVISDAAKVAAEKARNEGWFDVSTFKEPYRTEGKKIMGYELAEAFQWRMPDVIVYPTGGGTGLVGMWKAFDELEALGWFEDSRRPRMVAVQAEGCAPVVKAFASRADHCEFWEEAHTIASGLRVPKSFADRLILQDLYASHGMAVAVTDQAIFDSQKQLASTEGIFAAPEGAATLAALIQLKNSGWVQPEERVVLFNTGTGLKYL
ncbi:MAG: threonine synthase [Omnitrophica WOR_2 bacterium]